MNADELKNESYSLLWAVRRSIRYHARRQSSFESRHKWTNALQLLFGSAAVAAFLGQNPSGWGLWPAIAVTALAAADLVFGFDRMARLHMDLTRQWNQLEKQLTIAPPTDDKALIRYKADRLELDMKEPPVKRVLNLISHNEVVLATGREEFLYKIRWWQRTLANFWDINDQQIKREQQIKCEQPHAG